MAKPFCLPKAFYICKDSVTSSAMNHPKIPFMPFRSLLLSALSILILSASLSGDQPPHTRSAADIYQGIQKLQFLGSALYVAAHPDDENTRLIAYLANKVHAETAYLSLTRGDGGQNLIGPEMRELLGLIRTQELLAARRLDGGDQFFSRANDFGYSKNPEETLRIWDEDEVLADVVWVIRTWRPDVIINRFDMNRAGKTHGHHTASAILSYQAFDLAARRDVYPEQLQWVEPWQPRRLFYNTSWWRYGSREAFEEVDKSDMVQVDVGSFFPLHGVSSTEVAARSRSMHKSQGFGMVSDRGRKTEYLQILKGDLPGDRADLFEGVNTSWSRVEGGAPIGQVLAEVERAFDFTAPHKSAAGLLKAYRMIRALPDGHWKRMKQKEAEELILACLGFYAEAATASFSATPGEEVEVSFELTNRSPVPVRVLRAEMLPTATDTLVQRDLAYNEPLEWKQRLRLPEDLDYTNPYWLNQSWALGMYRVDRQPLRGLPETPRSLRVRFSLEVDGQPLQFERELVYKGRDLAAGEVNRPFEVLPPVFAELKNQVYIFPDRKAQDIQVTVRAGQDEPIEGRLRLELPPGWQARPDLQEVQLASDSPAKTVTFRVQPPEEQSEGKVRAVFTRSDGQRFDRRLVEIDYPHIPHQMVLLDNAARIVKLDIEKSGKRVGYVMGAGDEVPASLRQIGYQVDMLDEKALEADALEPYDAIILGVRAYNVQDYLQVQQPKLLEYVERGGTLVVQYNKAPRFDSQMVMSDEEMGPFPFHISRDRVTVEEAEVRFLEPDHPVLNYPNKISAADFEDWVQERGLYFPDEWDEAYTPILSMNDPGEDPKKGSLLVASYGEGHYVYTGLSFFRQLPAGVPGAFRLFANLISLGQEERP